MAGALAAASGGAAYWEVKAMMRGGGISTLVGAQPYVLLYCGPVCGLPDAERFFCVYLFGKVCRLRAAMGGGVVGEQDLTPAESAHSMQVWRASPVLKGCC